MPKRRTKWQAFFSRGQHPMLANSFFWLSFTWFPKYLNLPIIKAYRRDTSTYLHESELKRIISTLRNQLKDEPDKIMRCLKNAPRVFRPALELSKKISKRDWNKQPTQEVIRACQAFFKTLIPTFVYIYPPLWIEEAARSIAKQALQKKYGDNWEQYYFVATRPYDLTFNQRYRLKLLRTAVKYKNGTLNSMELTKDSEKISKTYGYLRTYLFRVNPYRPAEIKQEIKTLSHQTPKEELGRIKQEKEAMVAERNKIIVSLDKKDRYLMKVIASSVHLREDRIPLWGQIFTNAYSLLKETAKRMRLPYNEFIQLTWNDFLTRQYSRSELKRREQGYQFTATQDKVTVTFPKLKKGIGRKPKTVKGTPAYPGKVAGLVQIADAYTFPDIRKGVILVTAMTTPDAIPYLKRVKAIITDEGGATAHAAIVAREFNIPCIVGTKIATKVLKDGDKVKVDAKKGIIELISGKI